MNDPSLEQSTSTPSWFARLVGWWGEWRRNRQTTAWAGARGWASQASGREPNLRLKLPSRNPDFWFQTEFVVWCHVDHRIKPSPPEPLTVAKGDVSWRAQQIARGLPITEVEQCRAVLEMTVSEPRQVGHTGVVSWGHCTLLTADPAQQQAVVSQQDSTRRTQMREWQWADEEHQIGRLAELITDPLRATAWWLLGHQDDTGRLDTVADQFCRLRDRLIPPEGPAPRNSDSLGEVVDEFCAQAGPMAVEQLIKWTARLFETYQQDMLATRLREIHRGGDVA
jgi:hypothetical protein